MRLLKEQWVSLFLLSESPSDRGSDQRKMLEGQQTWRDGPVA